MKKLLVSAILAGAMICPAVYAMSEGEREARRMNEPPRRHHQMHQRHMHHNKMMHEKGTKHHKHQHKHHKHMKNQHMKKEHMNMKGGAEKMKKGQGADQRMEQRTKAKINQETELNNH